MTNRPTTQMLTMLSRILQHMISYIFIPKSRHQDDVSFIKVFLIDNNVTERKINMGYIIFQYMKVCLLKISPSHVGSLSQRS